MAFGRETTGNSRLTATKFYYGWVVLAACLVLTTISYGIRFSFGVYFDSFEQEFGWTRALTSSIFSIYVLTGSLFSILAGWIADRHGPKMVFIPMAFFALLGLALTSRISALWHILLSYSLLVAIGTGPTYVIGVSLATRWFKQQRGLALAIATTGVGLGSLLMAPFASYLIASYGWRDSFLVLGVLAFFLMVPCSFLVRTTPAEAIQEREPPANSRHYYGADEERRDFSLVRTISNKNFLLIIALWFFFSFCTFTVMTHIIPHALDMGIAPMQAAIVISISGFASMPARILMGLATDRFGSKNSSLFCALFMIAAMFLLTQSSSLSMFYVFAVLFGVAYGGLAPPTSALVGYIFGIRRIGFIFGLLEVGWVTGAAAGPALTGYIFDTTGSYSLAFWLGAFAALMIGVLLIFLKMPVAATRTKDSR